MKPIQSFYCYPTGEDYFSADLFLYARCAVVANGKDTYLQVLKNPMTFPKDVYFEALLNLPEKAWRKKTGEELEHLPKYMYETGFNPNGWGKQVFVNQ